MIKVRRGLRRGDGDWWAGIDGGGRWASGWQSVFVRGGKAVRAS